MATAQVEPSAATVPAHELDHAVEELRTGLPRWIAASVETRRRLLQSAQRRLGAEAEAIVAAACSAHGVNPEGLWAGDQWFVLAPFAFHLQALGEVLSRIAAGRPPLPAAAVTTRPDGRVTVRVWPPTRLDHVLFAGYGWRASVWMPRGVTSAQVRARAARAYRGAGFDAPGVALVLAPGNFSAGPPADALSMLYHDGCVPVVKLNPVNAYLRPFLERIFAEFIDASWIRFVDGGPEVGNYLAHHPGVDRVHLTGSATTYDALVWGTGAQGEANRATGRPLLTKPFTAELGGVNPAIVVPGPWTRADVRRQANRIVYSRLQNVGHLCSGTQILILPDSWDQADILLDDVRDLMRSLEPATPFYPGSDSNVARAIAACSGVEVLQPPDRRYLVSDLDPNREHSLFRDDVFADVLGVVTLPAPSVTDYLASATEFANQHLSGTLAATILIDPHTATAYSDAVDRAVDGLHYGAVGINESAGIAFGLRYTTWGGFPGHTPESIGSGIGVVGNAFMLEQPEKTVLTGPFRPLLTSPTLASHRGRRPMFRGLIAHRTTGSPLALPGVLVPALRG